jgi:hypothetical protein
MSGEWGAVHYPGLHMAGVMLDAINLLHRRPNYFDTLPELPAVAAFPLQSRCNAHQVQPYLAAAQALHTADKDSTVHCCIALCCLAAVHNACLHVLA